MCTDTQQLYIVQELLTTPKTKRFEGTSKPMNIDHQLKNEDEALRQSQWLPTSKQLKKSPYYLSHREDTK